MRPVLLWLVLIVCWHIQAAKSCWRYANATAGSGKRHTRGSKSRVLMTICSKLFGRVISSVAVGCSETEMKNCANDSKTHSCAKRSLWMKIPTDLYQASFWLTGNLQLQNSLRVNHFKREKFPIKSNTCQPEEISNFSWQERSLRWARRILVQLPHKRGNEGKPEKPHKPSSPKKILAFFDLEMEKLERKR